MTVIMDGESLDGLNQIVPSVYRTAVKLQTLQQHLNLHLVSIRHIADALMAVGGAKQLSKQEVIRTLNRMFHSVSQEVPGHVTADAPEQICSLMFQLYPRSGSDSLPADSLHTALILLAVDSVSDKYSALLSVIVSDSGLISRSVLRSLLQDVAQVPEAVQEKTVFGDVEAAMKECFKGVLAATVTQEHVAAWLGAEPRLLLWLPTLYRLSVSQNVTHSVRCHICKTRPLTGLRYRCLQCVNVHVCQMCFLTNKQSQKHKTHHSVLEFCTQPTWRESLSSLAHNARHALLPRRYTQKEVQRRRGQLWAELQESESRAPPTSEPCDADFSDDALQTEEPPTHQSQTLMTEIQNLHRDKWLLEKQVQTWRLAIQSDQGVLEDRCSEMEVTMETLRQHNLHLQSMLSQALEKMEAQHHMREDHHKTAEGEPGYHGNHSFKPTAEEEGFEEEETPSPTIFCSSPLSHDFQLSHYEEPADKGRLCPPMGRRNTPEEAEPREQALTPEDEEDDVKCSEEELLQETVQKLQVTMEMDRPTHTVETELRAGLQTGDRKRAELVTAAEEVGERFHQLVEVLRSNQQGGAAIQPTRRCCDPTDKEVLRSNRQGGAAIQPTRRCCDPTDKEVHPTDKEVLRSNRQGGASNRQGGAAIQPTRRCCDPTDKEVQRYNRQGGAAIQPTRRCCDPTDKEVLRYN